MSIDTYRHTDALSGITAYYSSQAKSYIQNDYGLAVDTLMAVPFVSPRSGNIVDAIAVRVSTVSGGGARVGRLGIYAASSYNSIRPATLVAEAGATISTAALAWREVAIAATLDRKYPYFLAMVLSHTGAAPAFWGQSVFGIWSVLGKNPSGNWYSHFEVAYPYAALPATFPAGLTRRTGGPLIFVRYSA